MKPSKLSLGASTMALASALRVAVQIAILPIIGRILGPHAYGQVALVSPFIFFSMLLAESGLGACIVRAETVTPALEGTVFCFSAALSLLFIALFGVLALPLGRLLDEPAFPALLMGMSSILFLASFSIVPGALLLRTKKYHWMAASDVVSSLGGLAGVTLGILLDWGAWSLVAQQIGLWICKLAVLYLGSRSRPRLIFHWSIIRENMQFGSNLTATSILTFIARNVDNVLIGRFLGTQVLGYYALAFQIAGIPQMILSGSVYFTVFSGVSEAKRNGTSPAGLFLSVLRGAALVYMPIVVGLAATASLSVPLILGEKWGPTVRLLVLLTPLGVGQMFGAPMAGVINGLGRTDLTLRIVLVSSSMTILAIMLGVAVSSDAVALGVGVTALAYPALALRAIVRECDVTYRQFLDAIWAPVAASLLMGAGVLALQRLLPTDVPLLASLVISVMAGILMYVLALFVLLRDRLTEDMAEIKLALRRRRTT